MPSKYNNNVETKENEIMKTVRLCKSDPLENQKSKSVSILIDTDLPDLELTQDDKYEEVTLKTIDEFYQLEATLLINALHNSLPQGTFDRLGIEFMKRKLSLYRGKTR